jgi:hypothetical protein
MRALILFCALAGRAMAGLIVTADPSTSATYRTFASPRKWDCVSGLSSSIF